MEILLFGLDHCGHLQVFTWPNIIFSVLSTVATRYHEAKQAPRSHHGAHAKPLQNTRGEGGGQAPPESRSRLLGRQRSSQVGHPGEPHQHHPRDHSVV